MVRLQDSEHFVAIIDTCDPPVVDVQLETESRRKAPVHNSIAWFVHICFCFFLGLWGLHSVAVCHHSPLSSTFANLLKLFPLLPWTHCVIKISAFKRSSPGELVRLLNQWVWVGPKAQHF